MSCDELTDYLHPILYRLMYTPLYVYLKAKNKQLWACVPCFEKTGAYLYDWPEACLSRCVTQFSCGGYGASDNLGLYAHYVQMQQLIISISSMKLTNESLQSFTTSQLDKTMKGSAYLNALQTPASENFGVEKRTKRTTQRSPSQSATR